MKKTLNITNASMKPLLSKDHYEENLLFFVDEQKKISKTIYDFLNKDYLEYFLKAYAFKAKPFQWISTVEQKQNRFQKITLMGVGELKNFKNDDWIKLGGAVYKALENDKQAKIIFDFSEKEIGQKEYTDFVTGMELCNYKFSKYFAAKKEIQTDSVLKIEICSNLSVDTANIFKEQANIISESVNFARDLVNEPSNILTPEEFCRRIFSLREYGLIIEVLEEQELKKLGFNALLNVAKGSEQKPKLAVMRWEGGNEEQKPLAFVGKGITFDSGGISIKPALYMEEMKGDMGGAAAVVGLMSLIAQRKSCANVIGIVALAENMPDGKAQKPGDIVTSLSKQTIEIINTDAEGRLALADALWYAKEKFKPELIIDLATLTGAILVALGTYRAGLFSTDEKLATKLLTVGELTGENLWQMPLDEAYDKLIDSKFADMKNSSGRNAGSITAAQFLKRFVGDTPWAHIDIAGTATDVPNNEYQCSWATGFGVRLLNRFVQDNYEN